MAWSASLHFCRTWIQSTTSSGRATPDGPVTYGEVRHLEEVQFSVYNFENADVAKLWEHLRLYEAECQELLSLSAQQPEDAGPAPLSRAGCL